MSKTSTKGKMKMIIREYTQNDISDMIRIWNEVVEEGVAFPQEECLDMGTGTVFFASQSYTGVAEEDGTILGLYMPQATRCCLIL